MVVDLPVLRSSWIGADAAAAHWRGRRGALPAVRCGACWHAVELDRRSDLRALPAYVRVCMHIIASIDQEQH